MLRGKPKRAALPVLTSTLTRIIVSVRTLDRPGPLSAPTRSTLRRPSAAGPQFGSNGGNDARGAVGDPAGPDGLAVGEAGLPLPPGVGSAPVSGGAVETAPGLKTEIGRASCRERV